MASMSISEIGTPEPPSADDNSIEKSLIIEIVSSDSDAGYLGGVNMILSSNENLWSVGEDDSTLDLSGELLLEFDEKDVEGLKERGQQAEGLYSQLETGKSIKEWKKLEANQSLGYNGLSKRTQRRRDLEAHKRQDILHRNDPQITLMRNFFKVSPTMAASDSGAVVDESDHDVDMECVLEQDDSNGFQWDGYTPAELSVYELDEELLGYDTENEADDEETEDSPSSSHEP
ncbi:hypothetical protein C0992_008237, partial [Termitomyces sp. T32_za158]